MPTGSSARFKLRMASSAFGPCCWARNSALPSPMPSSPLQTPAQPHRPRHDLAVQRHGLRPGVLPRPIQDQAVKVAIAHMPGNRRGQARGVDVLPRSGDHLHQARDRHDGVGPDRGEAGAQGLRRPVGVVPCLPEAGALGRLRRPGEARGGVLRCQGFHGASLLDDASGAAMEPEQKRRQRLQADETRMGDAGPGLQLVQQLDARDRGCWPGWRPPRSPRPLPGRRTARWPPRRLRECPVGAAAPR